MGFYGLMDFILQDTKNKGVFLDHMFVVKCDALKPIRQATDQKYYPIVDRDFIFGKLPWDEYLDANSKKLWYPTAEKQVGIINDIVCTGPYVPKFYNKIDSTWELPYSYKFFFKWGGPQTTEKEVVDPSKLPSYDVPDRLKPAIQITNPAKQHAASYLHAWDIRRGIATKKALKRMSDNIETDSSFCPDTEIPQKRKRVTNQLRPPQEEEEEIQDCLLSLCEENICQEPKEENLLDLIKQQQQQQQQLKYNILKLITHLKERQQMLQLQTGLLE